MTIRQIDSCVTRVLVAALGVLCACGDDGGGPGQPDSAPSTDGSPMADAAPAPMFDAAPADAVADAAPASDAAEEPGALWASGTRLRIRSLERAGATTPLGFFDSELGQDCAFAPAQDGVLRCLPVASRATIVFRDAGCTQPLALASGACAGTGAIVSIAAGRGDECAEESLAPLLAPFAGATYYEDQGGTCAMVAAPGGQRLFELGASFAANAFVAAKTEAISEGRIAAVAVRAADGARGVIGYRDTEALAACALADAQGSVQCQYIADHTVSPQYLSATCASELSDLALSACGEAATGDVIAVENGCETQWYRAGAPSPGPRNWYERFETGNCVLRQPEESQQFFSRGDALTAAVLPAVTEGSGAVQEVLAELEPGARYHVGFRDTANDASCVFARAADGQVRCFAKDVAYVSDYFTDSECTETVRLAVWQSDSCLPRPRFVMDMEAGACPEGLRQYRLGGELVAPELYRRQGEVCARTILSNSTVYTIGEEMTASLATAALVTE